MIGKGKYDDACTAARVVTKGRAALLIVIDGEHGSGFACQADGDTLARLPDLLEHVAAEIRRSGPFGPPRQG